MAKTANRFKKLNALSPEQREDLDARLMDGQPASVLTELIQQEWGLLADEKPGTVKKMLERYRTSDLRERVIHKIAEKATGTHLTGVSKKLNAMEKLAELVAIQETRLQKGLTLEGKGGLLLGTVTTEAKLYKEMLVDLGRLQLETGILQRAPKKLVGSITDENGNVRQFEWSEEHDEIFKDLDAIEAGDGIFEIV